MEEKVTTKNASHILEEAINEYVNERTAEKLSVVLNLLRHSTLYIPAMLKTPNQPSPCYIQKDNGQQYLPVYTSKDLIPEKPKCEAVLSMSFPASNSIVVMPELNLTGMILNPYSQNLVLMTELIQKLHEIDKKSQTEEPIQLTLEVSTRDARKRAEFEILPNRLFTEGEAFVNALCDEREALINQIFAEACENAALYPFTEEDFSIMALEIAEDLTLIRIDLPEKNLTPTDCCHVYITYNPIIQKASYYTVVMTEAKNIRLLGELLADGTNIEHGNAPVEGTELQKIIDLARAES